MLGLQRHVHFMSGWKALRAPISHTEMTGDIDDGANHCIVVQLPAVLASPLTKIVIGVDGGTESIRACCFDGSTGRVIGKSFAVPYPTFHPRPGWAKQDPAHCYENLCEAV